MDINSITLSYFSPTGTTAQVLEGISEGIRTDKIRKLDLTPPEASTWEYPKIEYDLIIVGAPVYGGRLPAEAVRRLKRIEGSGEPAVIVVVYGNRAYEDALLERWELSKEIVFKPFAGGVFIGEHSFSSKKTPIAIGRPDTVDLEKAREFGTSIEKTLKTKQASDLEIEIQIPGSSPYKEWRPPKNVFPSTNTALCTLCNTCRRVCPNGAISVNDTVSTDPRLCIQCSACVRYCPEGARLWKSKWVDTVAHRLSEHYSNRKEPEIYM